MRMEQLTAAGLCFLSLWGGVVTQSLQDLSIAVEPSLGRVWVGSGFTVTCSTTVAISNSSVIWYRVQDSLRYQLGVDEMLNKEFITGENQQRYQLSGEISESAKRIYTLKVTNARPEDTAQIECNLVPGTAIELARIAVCDDVDSNECRCMYLQTWTTPKCFTAVEDGWEGLALNAPALRRTTIGLGVVTGLLIIYSLVLGLLMCRDSAEELELKRRERAEYNASRISVRPGARPSLDDGVQVELSDAASDVTTSATASSSSSSAASYSKQQDACVIIRRNIPPGNTRISGRRSERSQAERNPSDVTGYPNEGFVSDTAGLQRPHDSGLSLIEEEDQSSAGRGKRKGQGQLTNLTLSVVNLSKNDRDSNQPVNDLSGGGEGQRPSQGQSTNNLSNKGQSSTNLSTSENRTASYTSNSTASAGPPLYDQMAMKSLQDTMI